MKNQQHTELPVGTYRVTADVINPEPDKRSSRWHHQAVIKAGMHLVSDDFIDDRMERGLRSQDRLEYVMPHWPLYVALIPHLELVAERPSDLVCRLGTVQSCRYVLDQLALMGKVTLGDVQEAYDRAGEESSDGSNPPRHSYSQ